jgi:phosphomannomutase
MSADKIHFGTDGWRGRIADDWTMENVRKVTSAIACVLLKNVKNNTRKLIVVGFDKRFMAEDFAVASAGVLADCGFSVYLSDRPLSSPALSLAVVEKRANAGIMITASHNPWYFCGLKVKSNIGCSADEEWTQEVERLLRGLKTSHNSRNSQKQVQPGKITRQDFVTPYIKKISSLVKIQKSSSLKIVSDPLYGTNVGYLERILGKRHVQEIHTKRDCMFGGLAPEPVERYLSELKKTVVSSRASAGLAFDGDGDRLGVVDENGRYLPPHVVFPLLVLYQIKYGHSRGSRRLQPANGSVVQTISLGYLSERIARRYGLSFKEVPVGFKYVAKEMLQGGVIGGEESGGYGFGDYLPERDGLLSGLRLLKFAEREKRSVSELVQYLYREFGKSCFERSDIHLSSKHNHLNKKEWTRDVQKTAGKFLPAAELDAVRDYDGVKFIFKDDSWLLIRPSGTEPLVRTYAESSSRKKTRLLLDLGRKIVYTVSS